MAHLQAILNVISSYNTRDDLSIPRLRLSAVLSLPRASKQHEEVGTFNFKGVQRLHVNDVKYLFPRNEYFGGPNLTSQPLELCPNTLGTAVWEIVDSLLRLVISVVKLIVRT